MKTKLIVLACIFIAPFAFGQAQATDDTSHGDRQQVNAGQNKIGTLQTFTPGSNLTISATAMTHPAKYRVAKDVQIQKPSGAAVSPTSIHAGTQVSLGFNAEGQVDRITLLDAR